MNSFREVLIMKNRRITIALIALTLVVATSVCSAFAEDLASRYSYITLISAGLRINGSSASSNGQIIPSGNYATDISVKLQQQQSDGSWVTVASWSDSNPSGACSTGGSTTITTGYTYRTYVVGHVYDGDGNIIDTGTAYKY